MQIGSSEEEGGTYMKCMPELHLCNPHGVVRVGRQDSRDSRRLGLGHTPRGRYVEIGHEPGPTCFRGWTLFLTCTCTVFFVETVRNGPWTEMRGQGTATCCMGASVFGRNDDSDLYRQILFRPRNGIGVHRMRGTPRGSTLHRYQTTPNNVKRGPW